MSGTISRQARALQRDSAFMLCQQPLQKPQSYVNLTSPMRPMLFGVVDTEEEFDWSAGHSRANTRVTAMRYISRGQKIFERYGLKPTYVIDYPVSHQPEGYVPLGEHVAAGRCMIGAHLHPWVNP